MTDEPAIVTLARRATVDLPHVIDRLVDTFRDKVPGYGPAEGLEDDDIRAVLHAYLGEVLVELGGSARGDRRVFEALIRRRAGEGVTLAAVLHTYRLGLALLWEELASLAEGDPASTEALVDATPIIFEMLDRYSLIANAVYHEIALRNARRLEQVRASLLDTVLGRGSTPESTFWDAVGLLGIPREGHFVVVKAFPSPTRTEGVAETPPDFEAAVLAGRGVESAWFRIGPRSQLGLIVLRPDHAAHVDLALQTPLERLRVSAGVSSPFTNVADTTSACAQAQVAASAVSRLRRLVRYDHDLLPVLLASAPDAAATLLFQTLGAVLELPPERRGRLLDTVHTWLERRQSVAATAEALHCHRNTVNYRLQQFQELTGRSFSDSTWAAQVVLALEVESRQRQ